MEVSHVAKRSNNKEEKLNSVQAKANQEERQPGYGDKKLEGPDRPSV